MGLRTLTDEEVVRLLRKHCTPEEQRAFRRAVARSTGHVTALMNFCLGVPPYGPSQAEHAASQNLTEDDVVRALRRVLRMLREGGEA